MTGPSPFAAVALNMVAFVFREAAHAQEYPWFLSRKVTSITSKPHRNNVSGLHPASAAAP
jgi:hypothetical protein